MKLKHILIVIIALTALRCTKAYLPVEITTDYGYLVVEGNVNPGTDSTIIKLSRTVKLSAKTTTRAELKAIVSVQSDQNVNYLLKETINGYYVSAGLNLDKTKKYRLSIKTTNGKTYLSDLVVVKDAPVIDSIGSTVTADGLNIYNNAHDATNNTRYYRYEYQETWQFQSDFKSNWIPDVSPLGAGKFLLPRPADQQIFTCWASSSSTGIILGSTSKLAQDILYQNLLTSIPSTSEKISLKYSILVKQYALTTDAYDFWTLMKKNTEELGSIFDSQPTALNGNIHNTNDATEPVIGYFSVGVVTTKRVFISKLSLPVAWNVPHNTSCVIDTAFTVDPISGANDIKLTLVNIPPSATAIDQLLTGSMTILGYTRAPTVCADCTLRGVNKQPAFWK